MEEEEGEVVIIMVGGTARGKDQGAIMVVVIDTGITDARETDLESEAGRQERRRIATKVRARSGVAHQGGRERGWRRRGREKERGMIVRMGQRGHTIKLLCQRDIKHDVRIRYVHCTGCLFFN